MKLTLKTKIEDSFVCIIDNKEFKKINLKKSYKLIFPETAKEVKIIHDKIHKKSIIGFVIMSLICFFLETQKTFEKREFISFYQFAENNLVSDFCFENKNCNKEDISVYLKEKNYEKFKCLIWCSKDVQINNSFSKMAIKHNLMELISFWFIVLMIPMVFTASVTIASYIRTGNVFGFGAFLLFFLFCIFIGNIITFVFQYKKIIEILSGKYLLT